jgi:hypothetical protein
LTRSRDLMAPKDLLMSSIWTRIGAPALNIPWLKLLCTKEEKA